MAKKGSWRRRATGTVVVALVAAGVWLGSHLGGFGLGGSGKGTGADGDEGARKQLESGKANVSLTGLNSPPRTAQRLRVIIDGDRLLIADSDQGTTGKSVQATEVARQVQQAGGDDQGIRVRIDRTKRATAGAHSELLQALDAAGIPREAIQESSDFL